MMTGYRLDALTNPSIIVTFSCHVFYEDGKVKKRVEGNEIIHLDQGKGDACHQRDDGFTNREVVV